MTKHREAKTDNTPLLLGGLAAVALLMLSTKKKESTTVDSDNDQTPSDPQFAMIADAARQFFRAFAAPNGLTLAQFKAGTSVTLAGDLTWLKMPVTEQGVSKGIGVVLSFAEPDVALQSPLSEAQFVRIILGISARLYELDKKGSQNSATGSTGSATSSTNSATSSSDDFHKYAQK